MKKLRSSYFTVFVMRLLLLYVVYALCRVIFALYNADITGAVAGEDIWSVVKGSLVFDSASIFYVNIPFILLSLLPFRFRERRGYQKVLQWVFTITNTAGLVANIADIFYFPFKLSRIASDDLHFLSEGNFGGLALGFLGEFWWGVLLLAALAVLLWKGFGWLHYEPHRNAARLRPGVFEVTQLLVLGLTGLFMIFAIRGFSLSAASYPITMSDASLYVKPKYASLVLSNPFCLIRTLGHKVDYPKFFPEEELDARYPVVQEPLDTAQVALYFEEKPNIVILVLESFAAAHLKSFSDMFADGQRSFTPFIDSLAAHSYIFPDAYQNGLRSIDALPAVWASIPSFKTQFLSMPNSVAEYHALPSCLVEMGYETMFLHGSVRESMGFVAFGQMAGVESFVSREDYEAERGKGDFDGKWGIWDHKFLPFALEKISEQQHPFCATLFTLSSHHPYLVPDELDHMFGEGNVPIQRAIEYSDYALRDFFARARRQPWYDNTLFILTADHGSGSDNEKYLQMPYAYGVPIIMHYTGSSLRGRHELAEGRLEGRHPRTSQHIDIMPTLLRMVGYGKPFFAFGRDMFNDPEGGFAVNYYGSAFNFMADSMRYVFNEREVVAAYNYREDYHERDEVRGLPADSANVEKMKAFIQQYYRHVRKRDYLPTQEGL